MPGGLMTDAPSDHPIKIILADDHELVLEGLRGLLQSEPDMHVVATATNGERLMDAVRRLRPDLVVMDLQMPEMDGYSATRQIRTVLKNEIPIIAMTADALKGEAERCFESGMNGYISKPFEPRELYAEILKYTRKTSNATPDKNPVEMNNDIVDFSYLRELSGNDTAYIAEVLNLFLGTVPEGLQQLGRLVRDTALGQRR